MATLKHIASKNSDYSAIEAYLIYQHDEFSGKVILDEQGRPMLRESYLLDTLECGDFSFATACLLANRKYGKNTQHGDIKSHQYIISFDPRDAADNGLTMETAQALGLKFCEENFPGHPAIVCTHPDGHNHSGNIHVHIVIGSIRTREVERKPYMQKPRDWREGMKHSSTAQTMRHLRVEVMELCEGAGLYQIDLLNGSKERVSEAEYWVRRRGQLKLDRENAALTETGQQPKQKRFETVKDTLRKQISSVLYRTTSFEEFSDRLMQQYSITVKESRGQLSYLPAGRTKFIRAKHLGDKFEKEQVLAALAQNIRLAPTIQPIATDKPDKIQKLVDIQAKLKQGKGIGYERWAKKHNLKAMAQTLILLQEKGLLNEDALDQRITELDTKFHDSLAVVKDLEGRMKANKELRYHVAAYTNTKNIAQQLKAAKRPAAFEEQHRAELTAYRTAAAYFKANDITKLPSPKKLEAEYAQLASEKAKFYEQYKETKEELLKLKTAKQNVASFFREEEPAQQER
ncbi:MAG: relaxase/mobilization nuclease domain-containing protein [Blautia massiliensis (ex Durand et al. 2017)]